MRLLELRELKCDSNDPNILVIKEWLQFLAVEIDHYRYISDEGEVWRRYSERPVLGLFVSGIARHDSQKKYALLQEYGVKNSDYKGRGRADLYIQTEKIGYMLEAKYRKTKQERGISHNGDLAEDFNGILNQALRYIREDPRSYSDLNEVYIVALIFHTLKFNSMLELQEYVLQKENVKNLNPDSFYALVKSKKPEKWGDGFSIFEIYGAFRKYSS
jgi:hypothetical protein